MIFFMSLAFLLISTVHGAGEFSVIHHAPSLLFKGHEALRESTLKEVYAASLGFSTEHFSTWRGMYLLDPFDVAQAIVTVYVDGVSNIDHQKGHRFPLKTDIGESNIFENLERRIDEHYPEEKTNLVRIELSNGLEDVRKYSVLEDIGSSKIEQIKHRVLRLDSEEDRRFIKEMTLLNAIAKEVKKGTITKDNVPDVFWFEVSGLHALIDLYGDNSTQVIEAKQILNEVILRLNTAFVKLYDGFVLTTVITSDASHTRRGRSVLASDSDSSDKTEYNLASYYNPDFPVMFNIILWFGVVMLFSIIAICMAIGNMDPGRDSIIYRMTSTRMKKDN
ncbi:ATPase H(+)-transporting accessory protein 2 [Diorhabda sublineata]|uniref:ATPase H(+)-transporting accessory protein 2 n=1 Tax=Diorhabda sublineata TaxID=1163346 RepID=UPI0024E18F18|nr:ATPase H(+)-transporting accessory protein 2 [Diorhabda sublineata]